MSLHILGSHVSMPKDFELRKKHNPPDYLHFAPQILSTHAWSSDISYLTNHSYTPEVIDVNSSAKTKKNDYSI